MAIGTMESSSVAFVILTWNSEAYVTRCLDSVLALPFADLKVFVVDNGSSDGTVDLLVESASKAPNLEVIRLPENKGTTVSRNLALHKVGADVDYVCVLDSDTEVNPNAFKAMTAAYSLDDKGDVGIMGPLMHNEAGERQLSGRNLPTLGIKLRKAIPLASAKAKGAAMERPDAPVRDGLQDVGYLLSACWLIPRQTLEKLGYLDENIFYAPEDVDYCARAHEAGLRVVLCHEAEILHVYQRISQKKLVSSTNASHLSGLMYYFKKHGYYFDASKVMDLASTEQ
jgi:GT2 family glycosyltransferase